MCIYMYIYVMMMKGALPFSLSSIFFSFSGRSTVLSVTPDLQHCSAQRQVCGAFQSLLTYSTLD